MKTNILIIFALFVLSTNVNCQNPINVCEYCNDLYHWFDFNSPGDETRFYFYFDTLQVNNIWEIGHPTKNIFTSGYNGPKALVTDTINPYPSNNISSFQISIKNCSDENNGGCGAYQVCVVSVALKFNSDSLIDGGTIEVSHNGSPFINIIEDPLALVGGDIYSIEDTISSMNKPGFTGTSSNWKEFGISYNPTLSGFDTITLRFTFSSDSIQTNKDGWMIGYIQTGGIFEGIGAIYKNDMVTMTPNPCSNYLYLQISDEFRNGNIEIYSVKGQCVKSLHSISNYEAIDITDLRSGIYFLQYSHDKYFTIKRIIKIN